MRNKKGFVKKWVVLSVLAVVALSTVACSHPNDTNICADSYYHPPIAEGRPYVDTLEFPAILEFEAAIEALEAEEDCEGIC